MRRCVAEMALGALVLFGCASDDVVEMCVAPVGAVDATRAAIVSGAVSPPSSAGMSEEDIAAVAQVRVGRASGGTGSCTGLLLTPRWVLTARHCFEDDRGRVRVDESRVTACFGRDAERDGRCRSAAFPAVSVQWRRDADVALVELDRSVVEHAGFAVRPAGVSAVAPTMARGDRLLVAGRGAQRAGTSEGVGELRFEELVVTSVDARWVRGHGTGETADLAHGLCNGDSGGPLYAFDARGRPRVVAVVTRGPTDNCLATPGRVDSFTRVHPFHCWIASYVGDLEPEDPECTPFVPYCLEGDVISCVEGRFARQRCPSVTPCGARPDGQPAGCMRAEDDHCAGIDARGLCQDEWWTVCRDGELVQTRCTTECNYDDRGFASCSGEFR